MINLWSPVLVETSLNLRTKKGSNPRDYRLSGQVAESQLKFHPDIIANVEDMECDANEYERVLLPEYQKAAATDDTQRRGVSCWIKREYQFSIIHTMKDPHFMHIRITNQGIPLNLLILRILISNSNIEDFRDRAAQWNRVMSYLDSIRAMDNIILTGDWNHGVIADESAYRNRPREYFNFQIIERTLQEKGMIIVPIEGFSYKGYMKIDHLSVAPSVKVRNARYEKMFQYTDIGIPDHSYIVATIIPESSQQRPRTIK